MSDECAKVLELTSEIRSLRENIDVMKVDMKELSHQIKYYSKITSEINVKLNRLQGVLIGGGLVLTFVLSVAEVFLHKLL